MCPRGERIQQKTVLQSIDYNIIWGKRPLLLSVGTLDVPRLIDTSLHFLSLYMELCVSNHSPLSLINKSILGVRILPEFRILNLIRSLPPVFQIRSIHRSWESGTGLSFGELLSNSLQWSFLLYFKVLLSGWAWWHTLVISALSWTRQKDGILDQPGLHNITPHLESDFLLHAVK